MTEFDTCRVSATRAAEIVGIKYATLDHWLRTDAIECAVKAEGSGSRREFDFLDLLRARAVARLRTAGVSLQKVRRVIQELERHYKIKAPLTQSSRLIVAGGRLHWAHTEEELIEVLSHQFVATPFVILDVGGWYIEIKQKAKAAMTA